VYSSVPKENSRIAEIDCFWCGTNMSNVTISKNEYRKLKAAQVRLDALSNVRKPKGKVERVSFADLRGALRDVEEFKGKTSVEVQKMIPELWSKKYRKSGI
jgi:hypothetical protein